MEPKIISAQKLHILLVDDHAVVHCGLKTMLNAVPSIRQITSTDSGASALELCKVISPDIILLDIRMPGMDGHNTLEILSREYPHIRVIILSGNDTSADINLAKRNGASGFVSKSADPGDLITAIQKITTGGSYFPEIQRQESELTTRELEVLQYLSRGLTNEQIGQTLGVSGQTIKGHLKRIFPKLSVVTRTEAVTRAIELNLL